MRYLLLIVSLLLLASCSTTKKYKPKSSRKRAPSRHASVKKPKPRVTRALTVRDQITNTATKFMGTSYVYGGKTPTGFDCSGFVTHVLKHHGVQATGSSSMQAQLGKQIPIQTAKPGDLVFFKNKGKIVHVSLVYENKKDELWVIHSTSSRGVVKDEILHSSYWKPRIAEVRDVIR